MIRYMIHLCQGNWAGKMNDFFLQQTIKGLQNYGMTFSFKWRPVENKGVSTIKKQPLLKPGNQAIVTKGL